MSSGFVSGGTTDNPVERDDEWLKAQQEIEANRRRREEESRQEGAKTLYEVLQSNKAAKQDAFEESIRLKNQFRNLDEDEVEFLDSVLESTRKKEEAVKEETSKQLTLFRQQQEEADKEIVEGRRDLKAGETTEGGEEEEKWAVNKGKRKRLEDKKALKGLKLRKSSSSAYDNSRVNPSEKGAIRVPGSAPTTPTTESRSNFHASSTAVSKLPPEAAVVIHSTTKPSKVTPPGLGLAVYSSDDED